MVTLKDIAEMCGVSVMTVSRVVNKQYSKVSKENIKKIESEIKKHGYVPNLSARSLSSKSSKIVSIILRDEKENVLHNAYNAEMVGYICRHVQERGYTPMLYSVTDYKDVSLRLQTWNAEGAIFFGMFDYEVDLIQEHNKMPLIFTDSYSGVRQMTNIGIDDFKGGQLAAHHFMEMGHRNIGILAYHLADNGVDTQRYLGFKAALQEGGLGLPDEYIFCPDITKQDMAAAFSRKNHITALFTTADILAVRMLEVFKELGIRVPEDCSLIGFDNLYFSTFTTPKLTTIGQDISLKAKYAVEMLFRHIETPNLPAENIALDVHLVPRESVRRI